MDKTAYCNAYSQVDSLRPLPMGLHKSLIQEQFRSFQDSCVGFFVSSQALRISSNCVLELHLDSAACLLFQHSAGWELGLHSEFPPIPSPPKMRAGGEQLCHIQQSGQCVSVTSVHLLICKGALCFLIQVMCAPAPRLQILLCMFLNLYTIWYTIQHSENQTIMCPASLSWTVPGLELRTSARKTSSPELHSQPLVLSF